MQNLNFPEEFAKAPGWVASRAQFTDSPRRKMPKIPANAVASTSYTRNFYSLPDSSYYGYCTRETSDIIIIDVDNCENPAALPLSLQLLISATYTERSVSGTGLHIVAKTNKQALPKTKGYTKAKDFEGQLSIANNYMVMTQNKLDESPSTLGFISPSDLIPLFNWNIDRLTRRQFTERVELLDVLESRVEPEEPKEKPVYDTPSFEKIKEMVSVLPLDKRVRIKEVYRNLFQAEYSHYDYWLLVGMALHDWGSRAQVLDDNARTRAFELFLSWSATDLEAYVSDEDVYEHWKSFSEKEQGITVGSIILLYNALTFDYPIKVVVKKKVLPNPDISEYDNFKYLVDKYNIRVYEFGRTWFFTGDYSVMEEYFRPLHAPLFNYYGPLSIQQVHTAMWRLAQHSLWRNCPNVMSHVRAWLSHDYPTVNLFNSWLDEDGLGEEFLYPRPINNSAKRSVITPGKGETWFDLLNSCIQWEHDGQDPQFCRLMLKKELMQLVKLHDPYPTTYEDNGGMFVLIGPENTYKTTFFKFLLPWGLADQLRKDINQELESDKNKRDFIRYLSSAAIVLVDEVEGFMNHKKSGSFFKSVISSNSVNFTDIYESAEQKLVRRAIIVGTSNELKQILSDNGSRRLWYARIRGIDTKKMLGINLQELYRELREEYREAIRRGETPWLMNLRETQQVTEQNKQVKARTDMDYDLTDIFPYIKGYDIENNPHDLEFLMSDLPTVIKGLEDGEVRQERFMKTRAVMRLITHMTGSCPNRAVVQRALERYCMDFIGQKSNTLYITNNRVIHRGALCMTRRKDGNWNHQLWILPTKADEELALKLIEATASTPEES